MIWKTLTFKHIIKSHFNLYSSSDDNVFSVISIGDSSAEFTASFEAKKMLDSHILLNRNNSTSRLFRIKLKEMPSVKEMMQQFNMLVLEAEAINAMNAEHLKEECITILRD